MEIRDPIHGAIHILDEVVPIIKHPFFQRLRNIKQLGLSEYIFPGATHTRYLHSLGVMRVGEMVFNKLFVNDTDNNTGADFRRIKETFKLACLLHDVGHAPLSHATEVAMPKLSELKVPKEFLGSDSLSKRQATHEDYTIKSIADSSFAESFKSVESAFGVARPRIADLITGSTNHQDYFSMQGINYFPILSQLVSSELDCDRMDYLLRDSYFCGVSYGRYDMDWLVDNLQICVQEGCAYLGISERAVVTFDDFLLGRYHMFIMVYFHYRAVCLEQILTKFLKSSPHEYRIPAGIEDYIEHDDHYLMKALRASSNPYAQALVHNIIPEKLYESFNDQQLIILESIQTYLETQNIEHIRCSSSGRLSKYYIPAAHATPADIKVVRGPFAGQGKDGKKIISDLAQATDLFQKFSKSHAVNRLHVDWSTLNTSQRKHITQLIHSEIA
jgi:uncharacterized protein